MTAAKRYVHTLAIQQAVKSRKTETSAVSYFTPPAVLTGGKIDHRLQFLARAAARFELVQTGAMDLTEAYDGLIVGVFCDCDRDRIQRWEQQDRRRARRRAA